ncbi:zinc-dependent alcohol dehydrogenase [Aquipuribacter nitratireducens]|uniref:Zinc-binding dehydrogenase n=1 Tax=Aquipuribacter nitratireducens TaxID=650104 RepID=A0ABW0GRA9_9MICO
MKAVCLTAPRRVVVMDVPEPDVGPGEVLVQVRAVGLCGSDLTVFDGDKAVPATPWVLGHECGGTVVSVGAGVDASLVGRTVVVEPNVPCRSCGACRESRTSLCPHRRILGMNVPGVLAERVVVPGDHAWPVPDDWPPQLLALVEPLAVAVAAVRRAGLVGGEDVAVVGGGALGLQLCLALVAAGHSPSVVDLDPARVAAAETIGARAHDDTRRYDVVLETAGAPGAVAGAVELAKPGGRVVLMGLPPRPVELPVSEVVRRGLVVLGSIIYDHPQDFRQAVRLAGAAEVRAVAAGLGAGRSPGEAALAFEQARSRPTKSWVDCSSWSAPGDEPDRE